MSQDLDKGEHISGPLVSASSPSSISSVLMAEGVCTCMYVCFLLLFSVFACVCVRVCTHSVPCTVGRRVHVQRGEACSWSSEAVSCVRHSGAHHQACHIGDCHGVPWRGSESREGAVAISSPVLRWDCIKSLFFWWNHVTKNNKHI